MILSVLIGAILLALWEGYAMLRRRYAVGANDLKAAIDAGNHTLVSRLLSPAKSAALTADIPWDELLECAIEHDDPSIALTLMEHIKTHCITMAGKNRLLKALTESNHRSHFLPYLRLFEETPTISPEQPEEACALPDASDTLERQDREPPKSLSSELDDSEIVSRR